MYSVLVYSPDPFSQPTWTIVLFVCRVESMGICAKQEEAIARLADKSAAYTKGPDSKHTRKKPNMHTHTCISGHTNENRESTGLGLCINEGPATGINVYIIGVLCTKQHRLWNAHEKCAARHTAMTKRYDSLGFLSRRAGTPYMMCFVCISYKVIY